MNQESLGPTPSSALPLGATLCEWPRVEDHLDLVASEARRMARRMPGHISSKDLVGSACVGLIAAVSRFSPSLGGGFLTFARLKIRAAMLDELRDMDVLPRRARAGLNRLERARRNLLGVHGREPTRTELAAALGVEANVVEDLLAMGEGASNAETLDAVDSQPVDRCGTVALTEQRDDAAHLARLLNRLDPRHQQVLHAYYREDLSFREIGQRMGVTESRVCQLHAAAVRQLRLCF